MIKIFKNAVVVFAKIEQKHDKEVFFSFGFKALRILTISQYKYILKLYKMTERKAWTQDEDDALKYLYEIQKIRKWSSISKAMEERFGLQPRNGKQCRQRYHNHLDNQISKKNWTFSQEKLLLQLHHRYGNSWAKIAKQLSGRTDNCIKNHFYSQMRKCLRLINKSIQNYLDSEIKPLQLSFVFKMFKIAEQRQPNKKKHHPLPTKCKEMRDKMMSYCLKDESMIDNEQINSIENLVLNIEKLRPEIQIYKRKNRTTKNNDDSIEKIKINEMETDEIKMKTEQSKSFENYQTLASLSVIDHNKQSTVMELDELPVDLSLARKYTSVSKKSFLFYEDNEDEECSLLGDHQYDTMRFLNQIE